MDADTNYCKFGDLHKKGLLYGTCFPNFVAFQITDNNHKNQQKT